MINALISRAAVIVFGTLYPAYASYKALKSKNSRALVKWIMYWIVYAFFTSVETVTDIFLSWLPLYYELKVLFIIWLLSPATKGTSYIYRKLVHPKLEQHEDNIDKYINEASKKGAETLLNVGAKSLNLCASTVLNTAIQGQDMLVDTLRRSYSTSDLFAPKSNVMRDNRLMESVKESERNSDDELDSAIFVSDNAENAIKSRHNYQNAMLSKVPENEEPEVFRTEVVMRQRLRPRPFNRSTSAPISPNKT